MSEIIKRCGVVALVGRPNVGKSSLINALLKEHAAIVSPKPQTTRNAVRCIYNSENVQIVFIDTPGLYCVKNDKDKLGKFLTDSAAGALEDADVACWLVEAGDRKLREGDLEAERVLAAAGLPVFLVVNKADSANPNLALALYKPLLPFVESVVISAKQKRGMDTLIEKLLPLIPEGEPLYNPDVLMDTTERFMASEIIRGRVLALLRDEVPHCTAVEIESYKSPEEYENRKKLYIRASLVVETEGQKTILIGASGAMIKQIGKSARAELEKVTGWPVYLDLWVKVSPHWRQTDLVLRRLGYNN